MKKGRADTMTHDYKRHGVTTLFAALNVLEGKVFGQCMKRHRHQEFIRFLNAIDARVPKKNAVHIIIDNYAVHKHPKVMEWIGKHPRTDVDDPSRRIAIANYCIAKGSLDDLVGGCHEVDRKVVLSFWRS